MSRSIFPAAAVAVAVALLAAPSMAQGVDASKKSAAELQQMFEKQKTRGLVIAPSGGTEAQQAPAATSSGETDVVYQPVATGSEINVRISFDFDSALLREDQKPKLTSLCEAISNMKSEVFRIVGHTDAKGSEAYNESLSLLRAKEVKRYMVSSCGIAEDRLLAIGAGEVYPVNASDPNAEENRRVEFQLAS